MITMKAPLVGIIRVAVAIMVGFGGQAEGGQTRGIVLQVMMQGPEKHKQCGQKRRPMSQNAPGEHKVQKSRAATVRTQVTMASWTLEPGRAQMSPARSPEAKACAVARRLGLRFAKSILVVVGVIPVSRSG